MFGVLLVQLLSESVPEVAYLLSRFETVGEDTASLERLAMWNLAIEKFKDAPIFGNGFWSFRTFFEQNLAQIWHANDRFQQLDAHNVYFQVLCETGILGLVIYLLAVGNLLKRTIMLVGKIELFDSVELRFGAMFSLCIQIFYLLYSMSGNCLYDIVFYFYALAAMMTLSLGKKIEELQRQSSKQR